MSRGVLPAAPLLAKIDRATPDLLREIGVAKRIEWTWRNQVRHKVSKECADRVLTASPFLWFDIWLECKHEPDEACEGCQAHFRARREFEGSPEPWLAEPRAYRSHRV